jgi:predicted lipase
MLAACIPAAAFAGEGSRETPFGQPLTESKRLFRNPDWDGDGIDNELDSDIKNNVFASTVTHTKPSASINTSYSYTYKWNYGVFAGDPAVFNYELCRLSSLISGLGYHTAAGDDPEITDDQYFISNGLGSFMKLPQFMEAHGMTVEEHNLHTEYSDSNVTLVDLGLRRVATKNGERDIVLIAMRGSNSTWREWNSNLEIGHHLSSCDPDFTQFRFGVNPEWIDSENHMGFDITANRVLALADEFTAGFGLDPANVVYWVVGHSRGGAVANICASELIKRGEKTFAYTFACPGTTTAADAGSYAGIFNIVNEDDLVPRLPFAEWGYTRYGRTAVVDMSSSMQSSWEDMMGEGYDHAESTLDNALSQMAALVSGPDQAYVYTCSCHGDGTDDSIKTSNWYFTKANREKGIAKTPACLAGYYKLELEDATFYWTHHCQPMIFFMQMLAAYLSGQMTTLEFGDYDIADKYETAKWSLALAAVNGVAHPHYCESYFIIADEVSAGAFN